jgi:DNA-binding response OmpR family regulator
MSPAGKYVLVAEDDAAVRMLEVEILRSAGYVVSEAGDGGVAIEALRSGARVDLIVLDLVMPYVDGWGVLTHVSGMAQRPPVLVVSGRDEIVPPGRLGEYIAGYVRKPFAIKQLLAACERALSVPQVLPAEGSRKEPRKSFVVEATLLSRAGAPVMRADIQQLSGNGFQLELAIPIKTGDPVRIAFQIPGREQPLELHGQVRWQNDSTLGAEIDDMSSSDQQVLRELIAG